MTGWVGEAVVLGDSCAVGCISVLIGSGVLEALEVSEGGTGEKAVVETADVSGCDKIAAAENEADCMEAEISDRPVGELFVASRGGDIRGYAGKVIGAVFVISPDMLATIGREEGE